MTPGFSMMGSGIYSQTITREVVCKERCLDCLGNKCEAIWEEDFETNDWCNVDQDVVCAQCTHTINYREERE